MPVTDPLADMLTRIRNAIQVRHDSVSMPHSKLKLAVTKILKEEGFIRDFDMPRGQAHPTIRIHLTYREGRQSAIAGLKRVSKPGLRVYVGKGMGFRPMRERVFSCFRSFTAESPDKTE